MARKTEPKVRTSNTGKNMASDAASQGEMLPEGGESTEALYNGIALKFESLALRILEEAEQTLRTKQNQTGVRDVRELFQRLAGPQPKESPHLERLKEDPSNRLQIVSLDQKLALAVLTAQGGFEAVEVNCESKIKTARNGWELALEEYAVKSKSITAVFREGVRKAADRSDSVEPAENDNDNASQKPAGTIPFHSPCHYQVQHATKGSAIALSLEAYGKGMAGLIKDLTTAFSNLISQLTDAWASTAQGEVSLIKATQQSAVEYWTDTEKYFKTKTGAKS